MPIPTRPIPQRRPIRAGYSCPRKSPSGPSTLNSSNLNNGTFDWKAEISLIDNLQSTTPTQGSRSLPVGITGNGVVIGNDNGVTILNEAGKARMMVLEQDRKRREETEKLRRGEVGMEGLINEGKGKREKKSTTAATLGFDLIPNPTILALPEEASTIPGPKSSLLSHSPLSPLLNTPTTSMLHGKPQDSVSAVKATEDEDEDLDEWEHVLSYADEDDVLSVLGELELEDSEHIRSEKTGPGKIINGLSYAAVLTRVKV